MATLDSISIEWTGAIALQNCKMQRHSFSLITDADTHDFGVPIIDAFWRGVLDSYECTLSWSGSTLTFNQSTGGPIGGQVLLFTRDYT